MILRKLLLTGRRILMYQCTLFLAANHAIQVIKTFSLAFGGAWREDATKQGILDYLAMFNLIFIPLVQEGSEEVEVGEELWFALLELRYGNSLLYSKIISTVCRCVEFWEQVILWQLNAQILCFWLALKELRHAQSSHLLTTLFACRRHHLINVQSITFSLFPRRVWQQSWKIPHWSLLKVLLRPMGCNWCTALKVRLCL